MEHMEQVSPTNYDFAGWATRSNQLCADGRTILPDAFKHHDGEIVPLIYNHKHDDVFAVLGKALLHAVNGDLYAYCKFNNTEQGNVAKEIVQHGDVASLSICANQLKHTANKGVMHGMIRELSLVIAGANPKARIESVSLAHGDGSDEFPEEIHIYTGEYISELYHSVDNQDAETGEEETSNLTHSDESKKENAMDENKNTEETKGDDKTVQDVLNSMNEEQRTVTEYLVAQAIGGAEEDDEEVEHSDDLEGGDDVMKHNVFDQNEEKLGGMLTHAQQLEILKLAKQPGVDTFKRAMELYVTEHADELTHGDEMLEHGIFEDYSVLFPEYELLKKGEPETLERDQSWISYMLNKITKSPVSRVKTRQADARVKELKAKGYQKKGDEKTLMAKISMIGRSVDPQTIYIKDDMHRDDKIDITDFDITAYQWKMMEHVLKETLALAALVGDGREIDDPDKIKEAHIVPVFNDSEMYTIRAIVDIAAARRELQGTNTSANFSENYIYAEAIIKEALYAREQYKGSGNLDFYCTPHLVNVMLLARDMNGRRIYDSVTDLARALNVNAIHTIEQLEGVTRTDDKTGKTTKLLGLFVNMSDYQFGATKGGQITRFEDFDMDFNKYKYMLETRLSGALTKLYSAIALEEPVEEVSDSTESEGTEG